MTDSVLGPHGGSVDFEWVRVWVSRYEPLEPVYAEFAGELKNLVHKIVAPSGIPVDHLQHRGKSAESFERKLRSGRYSEPLSEITDLAGVRLVTYHLSDVAALHELLASEFVVDDIRSIRKGLDLDPDRFGYVADHLIVRLDPTRAKHPEWKRFEGFWAELQVRTVAQHAWATISRKLDYTHEDEVPTQLRRRLFRLSALFELADDEFDGLQHESTALRDVYAASVANGALSDVRIDIDSLGAYIADSAAVDEWWEKSVARGFARRYHDKFQQELDLRELLWVLRQVGVDTLEEVERRLTAARPWGEKALDHIGEVWKRAHPNVGLSPTPASVTTMLILLTDHQTAPLAHELYVSEIAEAIATWLDEVPPAGGR